MHQRGIIRSAGRRDNKLLVTLIGVERSAKVSGIAHVTFYGYVEVISFLVGAVSLPGLFHISRQVQEVLSTRCA